MSDAPLNPLGNAIVACYALGKCYDVVLEPGVTARDTTFNLVVAFRMGDEALIILEVKLHRRDVDILETQMDEMYALGYHISLLKRGIRIGALHIYTSRQPPELANRWTAAVYLPPDPREVPTHVDNAIDQLLNKLRVRC
ncbi:MAG: hypothetical protein GU356_04895 [Pyrobaculum sp.]|nr:hypothetical protein [Pyrobaculum sp.]